jgi:hypothetical protein
MTPEEKAEDDKKGMDEMLELEAKRPLLTKISTAAGDFFAAHVFTMSAAFLLAIIICWWEACHAR